MRVNDLEVIAVVGAAYRQIGPVALGLDQLRRQPLQEIAIERRRCQRNFNLDVERVSDAQP